jgi:hypothetical protein
MRTDDGITPRIPVLFRDPVFNFSIWVICGLFLSYFESPLSVKVLVVVWGIGVTFFLYAGARRNPSAQEGRILPQESLVDIPAWLPLLAIGLGLFVRLYKLDSLSVWPNRDDGIFSFNPMELSLRWKPMFFYGSEGEGPFFLCWLQALYFKWIPPSLTSLWLYPALFSILTLPAAYLASRSFFSRSFSVLCLIFISLWFWPAFLGRFCVEYVILLLWECVALWCLCMVLKGSSPKIKKGPLIGLALVLASGFYIYPLPWVFVVLAVLLALSGFFPANQRNWKSLSAFCVTFFSVFLPFAVEAVKQGYGGHLRTVLSIPDYFSWWDRLSLCGLYLSDIFWGSVGDFHYGAVWGGLLNPFLGSLALLGGIEIYKSRRFPWARWLLAVLLLFLVPGFASHDLEMMRVANLIPPLVVLMAVGSNVLLGRFPREWRLAVFSVVICLSAGMDFFHLSVPYAKACALPGKYFDSVKSEESYNAYRILKEKADQDGPGDLALDFPCVPLDQTLAIATYPFNALMNPKLEDREPSWVAFLTNFNYRFFLEKRFPNAQWYTLGSKLMPWDGELMLGIVPRVAENRGELDRFLEVQPLFHEVTVELNRQAGRKSRESVLEPFFRGFPLVQGDPFLESSFWEIAYFNHSADKRFQDSFNDLTRILQEGYPAAHIFNELGTLLWLRKDYPNARKAFQRAVLMGGNHTLAVDNLRQLEGEFKN